MASLLHFKTYVENYSTLIMISSLGSNSNFEYSSPERLTLMDSQQQPLTKHNLSKIREGPSNITAYVSRYESSERRTVGLSTPQHGEDVTHQVANWDQNWKISGGK